MLVTSEEEVVLKVEVGLKVEAMVVEQGLRVQEVGTWQDQVAAHQLSQF